jgi:4-amino-4-deoxy-L-arabinose transferase-like glycosyltransferase
MPAYHPLRSANAPATANSLIFKAGLIGSLAAGFFALGLGDDSFVDEYAYITQSYQPDILLTGRSNDRAWLEFITYDLVPLPKYLINFSFRLAGIPRPTPEAAMHWYRDTAYKWGSTRALITARLPSIFMGAIGCTAIFAIGVLVKDQRVGAIAALLLAVSPLYRLHAHRAMSEAPCEAFLLLAVAVGMRGWQEAITGRYRVLGVPLFVAAGLLAGLAILAKFNGVLALLCFAAWCLLGLGLPRASLERKLMLAAGTAAAILAAWFVFLELNPFMTVHPTGRLPASARKVAEMGPGQRFEYLIEHRRQVSRNQQHTFSHNALHTLPERAKVVVVQGFGRFGPLGPGKSDSTVRYDWAQDWGAILWLPLVAAGFVISVRLGWKQYQEQTPPMAWLLTIWACLAPSVVTAYLPMAWDRYQLPIQAPAALLAAIALVSAWEALPAPFSSGEPRA